MNWTYLGIQLARSKRFRFGALLVNDSRHFTYALVYYNDRSPVRIVYLED